jgi:hypothetical protein
VAHVCNPSYSEGSDQENQGSKPTQAIVSETLSQKYSTQKRAGGVAQEVECLRNKHKALSLNSSTAKKGVEGGGDLNRSFTRHTNSHRKFLIKTTLKYHYMLNRMAESDNHQMLARL